MVDTPDAVINISDALRLGSVVLLGIVSYFLRRSMATVDNLEKTIHELEKTTAILLDRDRRKRLEDYDHEQG